MKKRFEKLAMTGPLGISTNKRNSAIERIKIGLGIAALTVLTGCVGVVDGGYGGEVYAPGPDIYVFGGGYERGHDVRAYSGRGFSSRQAAHPGGGGHAGSAPRGGGGHPGSGGGHGGKR